MKKKIAFRFIVFFLFVAFSQAIFAEDQIGEIIRLDTRIDDKSKTPLVFIHGIHGSSNDLPLTETKLNDYWKTFRDNFNNDDELKSKYFLYTFNYYSDKVSVRSISEVLGKEIDRVFKDRRPMLVAHSMGGLVAKNYMVYYNHQTLLGPQSGGDRVLGLITLSTPHHGTPGANKPGVLEKYFAQIKGETYLGVNWIKNSKVSVLNALYWNPDELNYLMDIYSKCYKDHEVLLESTVKCLASTMPAKELNPISLNSEMYNRKDLRWDNYDGKINDDVNQELFNTNHYFTKYSDKVILYAGILKPLEPKIADAADSNDHVKLAFADGVLYYDLTQAFGYTDGLVPYKSSMLCDSIEPNPHAFQCSSKYRVRRFEFSLDGKTEEVEQSKIQQKDTLSITKIPRGFDHKDMKEHILVWDKLKCDLLFSFDSSNSNLSSCDSNTPLKIVSPPKTVPVTIPEVPTLFLFDVSGSMQDNNKIEQARSSALNALQTLKDNQNKGLGNTSVSVWVFSGDACSPQMARQILPFTPNLNTAENSLRSQIPIPNGGTPLPQAVERTTGQMITYLQSRPNLDEGRIILLSDGQSTCNQLRPADVYSQARSISIKKTVFYTIGFDVPVGSPAERDLQYLASASGGQYFPAQNQQQLARAFQKTIRVYLPKAIVNSNPNFDNGVQQIVKRNYAEALKIWTIYVRSYPNEALGFYNLAVSCEALGRYKSAIDNYRQYLQLVGSAPDKTEIEAKIITLQQEQRDQFYYYLDVLRSDLAYLKEYYQRLFTRKNNELAQEFRGFVNEKQIFYANILGTMDVKSNFLSRDSDDLTASMSMLNNRVGLESFDRDAVSLLTIPIGQLEDLIERLEKYGNQNFK